MYEAIESLKKKQEANQTLVAAARRNGWMAWRPSLKRNRFVRFDEEPWCKKFREGSHRMQKDWNNERYSWLDESGMPTAVPKEELDKLIDGEAVDSYFGESGHTEGSNETQIYQEVTRGLGQGHDYHRHHNHHHDLAQCPPASR